MDGPRRHRPSAAPLKHRPEALDGCPMDRASSITGMTELQGPTYLGTAQDLQETTLQLQKN